jgi:hypothetical protein
MKAAHGITIAHNQLDLDGIRARLAAVNIEMAEAVTRARLAERQA